MRVKLRMNYTAKCVKVIFNWKMVRVRVRAEVRVHFRVSTLRVALKARLVKVRVQG